MSGGALWAADPHEYGPGKVHIIDTEEPVKTYCGKWTRAIPGKQTNDGKATCKICLNAVENRRYRKAQSEEWERQRARDEAARAQEKEERSREWWNSYNRYLRSDLWKKRRQAVLNRANGWCEGCAENRATQVHHTTYEHVGNELLWELKAVCDGCHERAHSDKELA